MKTKILLASVLFFLINTSKAQDSEKAKPTGYISINGGLGAPLGDFSNLYIGGASSGGAFSLNFSTPLFKSHFGLTTKIDIASYLMASQPFIAQQESLLEPSGQVSGTHYDFIATTSGSYFQTNTLVGLYITIPIKRFSFDARMLVGLNSTSRPSVGIDFNDYYYGYYTSYYENSSTSSSFAYDFGFGARLNLGKRQKLCLMLSFDFVGANGSFVFSSKRLYIDEAGNIDDSNIQTITKTYDVSTFNTTFGIGYVFGKK